MLRRILFCCAVVFGCAEAEARLSCAVVFAVPAGVGWGVELFVQHSFVVLGGEGGGIFLKETIKNIFPLCFPKKPLLRLIFS